MFDEMPNSNSPKFSGIRKRKWGEYVAEKWDPITRKLVWSGTFSTAEEASEAYLAKQREFANARHMLDEMPGNEIAAASAAERSKGYTFNTAEEASEACLVKQCEFASAHHVYDEMPSSNLTSKTAAAPPSQRTKADNGKTLCIKEISFRDKSPLLGAEWHNMGRLKKKDPFKKRKKVCKAFNSNMHESKNQGKEPVSHVETDRCYTVKRGCRTKTGLVGIRSLKNGKYGAEIRDPIKNKPVWLGTFDTIEEASQAYMSKKCEFFDVLSQGNCDQTQPLSSLCRKKKMDSFKTTRIVGVHKNQWGKYTSEIIDPISKKKIWLGTFSTYEEASKAYRSKKLEFWGLVEQKKKCSKKMHSTSREKKQVGKEKLVNVKQGYLNGERFQPKSAAEESLHANQYMKLDVQGSKEAELQSKMPVDFSTLEKQGYLNGERFQPKSAAKEMLRANQCMKLDVQGSKEAELQSKMPVDFSTLKKKKKGGQEDGDLWMGRWVQLPDGREVKISLDLGLPIIDNYGSLLGEFSSLDDLRIYDENIY